MVTQPSELGPRNDQKIGRKVLATSALTVLGFAGGLWFGATHDGFLGMSNPIGAGVDGLVGEVLVGGTVLGVTTIAARRNRPTS